MRNRKKTKILLLLLGTLALGACANSNESPDNAESSSPSTGLENASTAASEEDSSVSDKAENAPAPVEELPDIDWSAIDYAPDSDFDAWPISGGGVKIKKYLGSGGDVKIPEEIDGYPVVEIDTSAFQETNVTAVHIPDSVTLIQSYAFHSCAELTSVTIPDSVDELRAGTFYGCTSLTNITIAETVVSFGLDTFTQTPWLENRKAENPLVIVNNVVIDGTACSGNVVIPDGVTKIENTAFRDCADLTGITFPDSLRSISLWAFSRCTGLTDIKLPDGLTSLGEDAFLGCENIVITFKGNTYTYEEFSELRSAVYAATK